MSETAFVVASASIGIMLILLVQIVMSDRRQDRETTISTLVGTKIRVKRPELENHFHGKTGFYSPGAIPTGTVDPETAAKVRDWLIDNLPD